MLDKIEQDLLQNEDRPYFTDTIPVRDNKPLEINLKVHLVELAKYDTLNEQLSVLLEILLDWEDHRLH